MAKKKNPEQEAHLAEEQEPNAPEDQEETRPQEEQPQDQEPEEQEAEEETSNGEEQEEDHQEEDHQEEQPQEEQPSAPAQEPASDENAQLRSQLLNAQGRLAAYAAGVAPAMVDDAVTLAMAEAAKAGTVTESSVTAAMDAVLKRHPEWKVEEGKKKTAGGFKLGADRDNGGMQKKPGATQNVKRWNRYK